MAKKVTEYLNDSYGVDIRIAKLNMTFLGDVALKNVYIEDHHQDTLIFVQRLKTSVLSAAQLLNNRFRFGRITLDGARCFIRNYKNEKGSNMDIFAAKFTSKRDNLSSKKAPFLLSASKIKIKEGKFRYHNENLVNPHVIDFKKLSATLEDFKIKRRHVSTQIVKLGFYDRRGIELKKLSGSFSYTDTQMKLEALTLKTLRSSIEGAVTFRYDRENGLARFGDNVTVDIPIKKATIALDDVNVFYNKFGSDQYVDFSSHLRGTLNNFKADKLIVASGKSRMSGALHVKNIFSANKAFYVKTQLNQLTSDYRHVMRLFPHLPGVKFASYFEKTGTFNLEGNVLIKPSYVKAKLNVDTETGTVVSDFELNEIDDPTRALYKGTVKVDRFDLARLLSDSKFGKISFEAGINGKGFTRKTLKSDLKAKVTEFDFNAYTFEDILINGNLSEQRFEGTFVAEDKNLKADFRGLVDLAANPHRFNFKTSIAYIDLKAINLLVGKDSISQFKGLVTMNARGNTWDDMVGKINFKNTTYTNQYGQYYFKDFNVNSDFRDGIRFLNIDSPDIVKGSVKGKFKLTELINIFETSLAKIYVNYNAAAVSPGQFLDFNFRIHNKIVTVFFPNVKFDPKTLIRGSITTDDSAFNLSFKSPQLTAYDNTIANINLQIDTKNELYNTLLTVDKIKTKQYTIAGVNLVSVPLNDTLFFKTQFKGGDSLTEDYNLSLYHTLNAEKNMVFGFKKSEVEIKGVKWFFNPKNDFDNKVLYDIDKRQLDIKNISFVSGAQKLLLHGTARDSTYKDIRLSVEKTALKNMIPPIDSLTMKGIVTGNLNILQQNGQYHPVAQFSLTDFEVNNVPLGAVHISAKGEKSIRKYRVAVNMQRDLVQNLRAEGIVDFTAKQATVDLNAFFDDFLVSEFSPLGKNVISHIRGSVTGKVHVKGLLKNPDFSGGMFIQNGGIAIPYLNVDYAFKEKARIKLYGQTFEIQPFRIADTEFDTYGKLEGTITHKNFKIWKLDLKVTTDGMLALNTTENENGYYHGTGFISGEATVRGYTDALKIAIAGKTTKGTRFVIPLDTSKDVGDNPFIHFVSSEEKQGKTNIGANGKPKKIRGLDLDFDLDITPESEVEIVVDKRTGSTLQGKGEGTLLIEMNTNGKFEMWGDFIVHQGKYRFKYGDLVDKFFDVKKGSYINWEGSPDNAELSLEAIYRTKANPSILTSSATVNRKVNTNVIIQIKQKLSHPEIDFAIEVPGLSSVANSELQFNLNTEEKRTNQALALIIFNNFYNEKSTNVNNRGLAAMGNLYEKISNLVTGILSRGGDLQIGLNYTQGERSVERQTEDQLGISLSTQISGRILINGNVGVPVGRTAKSSVVGDVEVEFLIDEKGTLRAKIFNRQTDLQYSGENEGYTQGVGLSYQVGFDDLKDLKRLIFNGKKNAEKKVRTPGKNKENQNANTKPDS